jgi:MFS family permease
VAFYKNSYNLLAILLLPFFGKLIGRIDPRKFSAITFASLLFYLLFIALTQYIPAGTRLWDIDIYYTLFAAMMFNGVFAATMSLLWSIGSSYFCKKEEASNYQSIHLSFTGLRSFFAPVLGIYVYQWLGFTGAFAAGILFLVISIIISIRSYKSRIP